MLESIVKHKRTNYFFLIGSITLVFLILCADIVRTDNDDDSIAAESTDISDIKPEGLQATLSPNGNSGIINPFERETTPRKRRRGGRKRKRRPHAQQTQQQQQQILSEDQEYQYATTEDDQHFHPYSNPHDEEFYERSTLKAADDDGDQRFPPRNWTPSANVERVRDPIEALEREQYYAEIREKNRQQEEINFDKSYRRPYSAAKRESEEMEMEQTLSNSEALKNILKQAGGLSLSEILQQRNLSLGDLLKGKQMALAALAQPTPVIYEQPAETAVSQKVALPPHPTTTKPESPLRRLPANYISQKYQKSTVENSMTADSPPQKEEKRVTSVPGSSVSHSNNAKQSVKDDDPVNDENNRIPPTIPNIRDRFSSRDRTVRPIKEVIPAIRPDLSNSNTKRFFSNRTEGNGIRLPPRWKGIPSSADKSKKNQIPITTMDTILTDSTTRPFEVTEIESTVKVSTTTTTTTPAPSNSTWISKNPKNRLSLRPRLRSSNFTKPTVAVHIFSERVETTTPTIIFRRKPAESIDEKIKKSEPSVNTIPKFPTFNGAQIQPESVETLDKLFDFDPNEPVQHNTQRAFLDVFENIDVTEVNPSLFSDITSVRSVDDRTDILELMEDRRSGARLAKVLASRNMSLEELIEHRMRGSSQLHLAEIFNNQTNSYELPSSTSSQSSPSQQQSPSPSSPSSPVSTITQSSSPLDKMEVVTAFETFPKINLDSVKIVKPDEIKTDSQGSSYFTSIISIKPTDEIFKEPPRAINILHKTPEQKNEIKKSAIHFSDWRMPKSNDNNVDDDDDLDDNDDDLSAINDDIDNSLSSRSNDILDLELSGHNFIRNSVTIENASIPVGVRSAIFASSCIVIVSVVIFILIFLVCRWRQKRCNKLAYNETFENFTVTGSGGHLPILERKPSKRSTSPVVYTTRASKLNTMDPNSPEVQDYLYDAMRRPYQ